MHGKHIHARQQKRCSNFVLIYNLTMQYATVVTKYSCVSSPLTSYWLVSVFATSYNVCLIAYYLPVSLIT